MPQYELFFYHFELSPDAQRSIDLDHSEATHRCLMTHFLTEERVPFHPVFESFLRIMAFVENGLNPWALRIVTKLKIHCWNHENHIFVLHRILLKQFRQESCALQNDRRFQVKLIQVIQNEREPLVVILDF